MDLGYLSDDFELQEVLPQPPRDPQLPRNSHAAYGWDRESVQRRKRIRLATLWIILSLTSGFLLIGMILGILPLVISPGAKSTVYICQLNHKDANASSFINKTLTSSQDEPVLPNYVRLGVKSFCTSDSSSFKDSKCINYNSKIHWNNLTEIYSSLLNTEASNVLLPQVIRKVELSNEKSNSQPETTTGFSSNGQAIGSPVLHGISLLFIILALGAMGYRSTSTLHGWLAYISLCLMLLCFVMCGMSILGDTWGIYLKAHAGFLKDVSTYGAVDVKIGWGLRIVLYVLNVVDILLIVLLAYGLTTFMN